MGYYTNHSLELENKSTRSEQDVRTIVREKLRSLDILGYALDEEFESEESTKWYSHNEDMRKISSEVNDVVFRLKGYGEESEDIWIEYYLNGKSQRCEAKISFDEFDISKLK